MRPVTKPRERCEKDLKGTIEHLQSKLLLYKCYEQSDN